MSADYYLGIDVGTGSARAGIFDAEGVRVGLGTEPIELFRPAEDFVEHSSADIWRACGVATRAALKEAGLAPEAIGGIGFDATCSLVVLGDGDRSLSVSPDGDPSHDVIVWMDHRATDQAARINETGHEVLRYVGGTVSPEMQTPKLLWLKERAPETWAAARRFLDLPDFLVYRATGEDIRSVCTTVCKWTYLGHVGGWEESYFRAIGLGELADESFVRIGERVQAMGERAGLLTATAATELGLVPGIPVSVAIIDAHAGGLGLLGMAVDGLAPSSFDDRLALIGGTSSCHMAVSPSPRFIPGIWGPYFSAMVPDRWLTEGGQSATGSLIDHTIRGHARSADLAREADRWGMKPQAVLNSVLTEMAKAAPFPAALTRDLHVLPDHHGNRSPRADASLRGMVSGLKLTDSMESLALLYLATVQAIAHGTKHIVSVMNDHGYAIRTILATGGDAKNEVFLREHADVTGCRIVLPREPESVLLGAAMLGAVAAGRHPSVVAAMAAMSASASVIEPAGGETRAYHDAKHRVFLRMHDDQLEYRRLMENEGSSR